MRNRFTALITGREGTIVRSRIGQKYRDNVTLEADNQDQATSSVKNTLLPGERLIYIGPGDRGHDIPPARG